MIYKHSHFAGVTSLGDPLIQIIYPDKELVKTAGVHPEILAYKSQLEPEPNKTYVHILALGAGEWYGANLNNDHFPWTGLEHDNTKTPHQYLHGYKTFLNAHAFAHHVNKDPEKAYGDVLLSVLNDKMKRVELIAVIDHEKCEANGGGKTLQKIHDGQYPSTSMGCRVPFDVCSICGHKAKYRSEYCEHMLTMAGKVLPDGRKVFVYNPFPRFFDISFVFIGADRTSFVLEKIACQVPRAFEKNAGFFSGLFSSLPPSTGGIERLGEHESHTAPGLTPMGAAIGGTLAGAIVAPSLISGIIGGAKGLIGSPGRRFTGAATGFIQGAQEPIQTAIDLVRARGALNRIVSSPGPITLVGKELDSVTRILDKTPASALRGINAGVDAIQSSVSSPYASQKMVAQQLLDSTNRMSAMKGLETGLAGILGGKEAVEAYHYGRNSKDPLEKESEVKIAIDKMSDIFKDVESLPMGRAVPILENSDADLPNEVLNELGALPNFPETLSSLGSMGIILKPREFQRASLVRMGQLPFADELDARNMVFSDSESIDNNLKINIQISTGKPEQIFSLLEPFFRNRSSLTPIAIRRISFGMHPSPQLMKIGSLGKLSSAYNGYRLGTLLNLENLMKTAMYSHDIIKTAESLGSSVLEAAHGTLSEKATLIGAMAAIPLIYFASAHLNNKLVKGEDIGFVKEFMAKNPSLSAALVSGSTAIGLHELFRRFPLEKIVEMAKTLK